MKLESGNIWSGDRKLAVLTNMTELAYRKGNLRNHYPVFYAGVEYADAEAAYQALSKDHKHDIAFLHRLMVKIITAKLRQYPKIRQAITDSGGAEWIEECFHRVHRNWKHNRWEGDGLNSEFIKCVWEAYIQSAEIEGYV